MSLNETKVKPTITLKRSWRNYSTELLHLELIKIEFDTDIKDVQSYWNSMEQKLMTNRLTLINNIIEYNWLNLTFDSFKVKSKNLFLIWYYELKHSVHNELILITMAYKWPFLKCKLFYNEINFLKKVTFFHLKKFRSESCPEQSSFWMVEKRSDP